MPPTHNRNASVWSATRQRRVEDVAKLTGGDPFVGDPRRAIDRVDGA